MDKVSYKAVDELVDFKCKQLISAVNEPLKAGDEYHSFMTNCNDEWVETIRTWKNEPLDYALLLSGMVFRTTEEACAALPAFAKKFNAKYRLFETQRIW